MLPGDVTSLGPSELQMSSTSCKRAAKMTQSLSALHSQGTKEDGHQVVVPCGSSDSLGYKHRDDLLPARMDVVTLASTYPIPARVWQELFFHF